MKISLPKICIGVFMLAALFGCTFLFPKEAKATDLPVVYKSGTLSTDETWTAGNVYIVSGNVTVPDDVTLTINAGTIVKYQRTWNSSYTIQVSEGGLVNVTGSSGNEAVFTSASDDSVGGDSNQDGNSTGSVGDYSFALRLLGGSAVVQYASFHYGSEAIECSSSSAGVLTVEDSAFADSRSAIAGSVPSVSLKRNHFNVSGNQGVDAIILSGVADLSTIVLSGSNKNTFSSSTTHGKTLMIYDSEVPVGHTWTVSSSSGVVLGVTGYHVDFNGTVTIGYNVQLILKSSHSWTQALNINGTLNIKEGAIVKVDNCIGLRVYAGGKVNVAGISNKKVTFTSYKDDTVGGDSNDDGASSGNISDYSMAIDEQDASTQIKHAIFKYGQSVAQFVTSEVSMTSVAITHHADALHISGGTIHLADLHIADVDNGLYVYDGAKVDYRGSFSDISGRAITACNWGGTCSVDASYVDWGSVDGPQTGGSVLACGNVQTLPWKHGSSTYDGTATFVPNCNSSSTPAEQLSDNISAFQHGVSVKQDLCSSYQMQAACDAIDTAMACLAGAVNVASSTSSIPLPGVSDEFEIASFSDTLQDVAAGEVRSQAVEAVTPGLAASMHNLLGSLVGTFTALSSAYGSCAP